MLNNYTVTDTKETEIGRFKVIQHKVDVNGMTYPYSYIDVQDSVAVLARIKDRFVFIKQYRKTIDGVTIEIPGGAINNGEEPEIAAIRELKEETGYIVDKIYSLGSFYPTIGISNEKCYLFFSECKRKGKTNMEELERIETIELAKDDIEKMISDSKLMHSMALVAWLRFKEIIC